MIPSSKLIEMLYDWRNINQNPTYNSLEIGDVVFPMN